MSDKSGYDLIYMTCKDSNGTVKPESTMSIERLVINFFHESFSSDRVYVISPWISSFELKSKEFIHYPYVSSRKVIDVIKGLVKKGTEVKILTRCADDALDISLIRTIANINTREGQSIPSDIRNLLKRKLDDLASRLESTKGLVEELGENLRFDLGDRDDLYVKGRLHSKLYINHRTVIMGSANFTSSGITDEGNWECLVRFSKDEDREIYEYAVGVVERYLAISKGFDECESRVIKIVNRATNLIGEKIYSIEDLIDYLNRVKEGLDLSVP